MGGLAHGRVYAFLLRHAWVAFMLLGVSFVAFGLLSLNLIHLLMANFEFLAMYGVYAVREGGLAQLAGIVVSGYVAAACYVVFKLCEKVLVERLAGPPPVAVPSEPVVALHPTKEVDS